MTSVLSARVVNNKQISSVNNNCHELRRWNFSILSTWVEERHHLSYPSNSGSTSMILLIRFLKMISEEDGYPRLFVPWLEEKRIWLPQLLFFRIQLPCCKSPPWQRERRATIFFVIWKDMLCVRSSAFLLIRRPVSSRGSSVRTLKTWPRKQVLTEKGKTYRACFIA